MVTWATIDDLALKWDSECLRYAQLAVDPDKWDESHFNIERAFHFAMVASALHRMKDRADDLEVA